MKYYRIDLYTIFEDCNQSVVFAFADNVDEQDMAIEFDVIFGEYLCAFSKLLGDPGSYTSREEYDRTMDYYVRNTDYDIVSITQEEFENFEKYDNIKN